MRYVQIRILDNSRPELRDCTAGRVYPAILTWEGRPTTAGTRAINDGVEFYDDTLARVSIAKSSHWEVV